ncbi:MAG: hypothetical protein JO043_04790 [Candidatus Eremiobacteraeota bacterium]|nr:hypothetical protein [Candidatus Eremiobacteraeota bacterium]
MESPLGPVVRLLRTPASFEDAATLYHAAALERCIAALHGNFAFAAHLLRVRALMRLARFPQALSWLEDAETLVREEGSSGERGEVAMLLGAIHHRMGHAGQAEEHFSVARAHIWSTNDSNLHAELARHLATMHWSQGDLEAAERHARLALSGRSLLNKALALELLGAVEGSRGHFHTQVACAEEALDLLEQLPQREVWVEGAILRTLAILTHQLTLRGVAERVERRVTSLPWTPEMSACHYETLRNLGWCAVVEGDHLKAFRLFRESALQAPSKAWQIFCFLDRSLLAREMGERLFAAAELEQAEHLAANVRWDEETGGERCALLLLAELIAPHEIGRAEAVLRRYRSIKPRMSALLSQRDGMLRALECHAYGIVAAHAGRRSTAAAMLEETFSIWRSLGFVWRATRTALEIADVLGDHRHIPYAREHVGRFPNSWFARSPVLMQATAQSAPAQSASA